MTVDCDSVSAEVLWSLIDETGVPDAELLAHLKQCDACTERLDGIRRVQSGLRAIGELDQPRVPERVGSYRIVRALGAGGMGLVYEAEQDKPARRVALKVMHPAAESSRRNLVAFRREIQALGRLSHPSIAAVHDAGATEHGQLYLVMELVDGERLDRYCEHEGERLSLRARVELIASIAEAIHHAHQRGVIHRDLKPANVLIDRGGRPHVLDFGLARFLDPETDVTLTRSVLSVAPAGTLPYMSPEQLVGDDIALDVRTDVYSLGVMLYQLLTGQLPHRRPSSVHGALLTLQGETPRHPSKLDRRVPSELGDVVLKAIAYDREHRYGSASALADDLRHFLVGEAVTARPASYGYRVQVFVRRHRALVGAVAASFVALAAGGLLALDGMLEARLQRDELTTVTQLMNGVLRRADPGRSGTELTVQHVFDRLATPLEAGPLFEHASLAEADLCFMVGAGLGDVNERERALPLLRRAVELRTQLLGPLHPDTIAARLELGTAVFNAPFPDSKRAASEGPEPEARAAALYEEGIRVLSENVELYDAGRVPLSLDIVGSLRVLAFMLFWKDAQPVDAGRRAARTRDLELRALELVRTLPSSDGRTREEGWLLSEIGGFPSGAAELDECVRFAREGLALRESLALRETGGLVTWDVDQAVFFLSESLIKRALAVDGTAEHLEEAEQLLRRACDFARSPWIGTESMWGDRVDRCRKLGQLLLVEAGKPGLAAEAFAEALTAFGELPPERRSDPMEAGLLSDLLDARRSAGDEVATRAVADQLTSLLARADAEGQGVGVRWILAFRERLRRRPAEEIARHREMVALRTDEFGPAHAWTASARFVLATALERGGQLSEAVTTLADVLAVRESAFGTAGRETLCAAIALESARYWMGEAGEPSELQDLARRAEEVLRTEHAAICMLRVEGLALADRGDHAAAEERLRRAVGLHVTPHWRGESSIQHALAEWALARVLIARGAKDEAEFWLRDAYVRTRLSLGDALWQTALVRCELARLLSGSEPERSARIFDEAFPVLCAALGGEHRFVREFRPSRGAVEASAPRAEGGVTSR